MHPTAPPGRSQDLRAAGQPWAAASAPPTGPDELVFLARAQSGAAILSADLIRRMHDARRLRRDPGFPPTVANYLLGHYRAKLSALRAQVQARDRRIDQLLAEACA